MYERHCDPEHLQEKNEKFQKQRGPLKGRKQAFVRNLRNVI